MQDYVKQLKHQSQSLTDIAKNAREDLNKTKEDDLKKEEKIESPLDTPKQ